MLDLAQLSTFIQVAEAGSFTAAGIASKVSKSNISRNISSLESDLGVRLFERTTRKMRLTQAGEEYYQTYKPLIDQIQDEHQKLVSRQGIANGLLRIAMPAAAMGHSGYVGSLLAKYQQQYPEVSIEVIHTKPNANLIEEKCDIGFHLGELPDSSMIARHLGSDQRVLCATPEYIRQRGGLPFEPRDLNRFQLVSSTGVKPRTLTLLDDQQQEEKVRIPVSLSIEHQDSILNAVLSGAGIGELALSEAKEALDSGQLVTLFDNTMWQLPEQPRYIVFPSKEHLPLKARKFIDFLLAEVAECEFHQPVDKVLNQKTQLATAHLKVVTDAKTTTVQPVAAAKESASNGAIRYAH